MSQGRAVRIPRARSVPPRPRPEAPSAAVDEPPAVEFRPNAGGLQRARRLAIAYIAVLLVGYAGFVAYDRSTSGGQSSGATSALLGFGEVALALAIVGAVFSLISAPRGVEVTTRGTRVLGVFGFHRRFPPLGEVDVRIVRRYSAGFLSSVPTVSVELTAGALRRTYLLEDGLLAPNSSRGSAA